MEKEDYKYKERHEFKKIFGFDAPICPSTFVRKKFAIDIIKLDSRIPNYNPNKCTYKGKPKYSLEMAIKEEYGEEAAILVKSLL